MVENLREIEGDVNATMQRIEHDGALNVKGNIEPGSFIVATHDIHITGEVYNAKIKSIKGNISIDGGVKGPNSLIFTGEGDIATKLVYNATLKAENNVRIEEMIIDAHIVAKKCIFAEKSASFIEGGEIEAGRDIIVNTLGSDKHTTTIARISDFQQRELYSVLLRYQKDVDRIKEEMTQLEKFIEVIKLLGNKVVTLPLEKKQDLAMKVKRYNELNTELKGLETQMREITLRNRKAHEEKLDELERTIIVRNKIYSGVVVYIDKTKLQLQKNYSNVILYKRGIIIVGDYDNFMYRKKYAY